MNYQVTWYGQIISPVVATLEEAKAIEKDQIAEYKHDIEVGWTNHYNPDAIQIQATSKKVGSY